MKDDLRLSTGTVVQANRGIIGIDESLDVFGGYDEHVDIYEFDNYGSTLTNAERAELASIMIARWEEYRACASEPAESEPRLIAEVGGQPTVSLGVFR